MVTKCDRVDDHINSKCKEIPYNGITGANPRKPGLSAVAPLNAHNAESTEDVLRVPLDQGPNFDDVAAGPECPNSSGSDLT